MKLLAATTTFISTPPPSSKSQDEQLLVQEEHLLVKNHQQECDERQQPPPILERLMKKLQTCSVMIGICFGLLFQLSTLGANFLLVALLRGEENVMECGQKEAHLLELVWSFFTAFAALIILSMLRGLIVDILDATTIVTTTADPSTSSDDDPEDNNNNNNNPTTILDNKEGLLMAMENRFVIGSLFGICIASAYTCTHLVLFGIQCLTLHPIRILALQLIWYKIIMMIWYSGGGGGVSSFTRNNNNNHAMMILKCKKKTAKKKKKKKAAATTTTTTTTTETEKSMTV